MKKKLITGLFVLLSVFIMTGCNQNNKKLYDIVKFEYNYGGYPDGTWDYTILKNEDNSVTINAKGMNGVDLNLNKEIDASVLLELESIINENEIYKWNGFSKKSDVMDGYSFSILVEYSDGSKINANGLMKYPDNYEIGHKALSEYLKTIK